MSLLGLFVAAILVACTTALDPPSNWRICDGSLPTDQYETCVAEAARDAIISIAGGLKSFKILPIEPLAVDSVKIGEAQGSVSLRQEYRNIKLHGLATNIEIKKYHIDWDKCLLSSDAYNPQVDFVADYKVDGKVLLLPVTGTGRSNITMYDLKTHSDIYCEKYEKDGETYLRVKRYVVKFTPKHVNLQFDNLFNGDNVLGEQMNRFINENSDLLFKELQGPYEETFGLVFTKISNDVFSRVPFNKLFPSA